VEDGSLARVDRRLRADRDRLRAGARVAGGALRAAGLGTLSIPVVGVAAAWIQLGEVPTLVEGIGMALIITALAVLAAFGLLAGRRQAGAAGQEPDVRPVTD